MTGPEEQQTVTHEEPVEEVLEDGVEQLEATEETATNAPPEPEPNPNDVIREQMAQRRFESSEESEKAEDVAETLSTDDEEAPKTFTVKVDGKETEVTEDEQVKAYQIDSAAQKRLQEATETRRAVEQERAELEALRQQPERPARPPISRNRPSPSTPHRRRSACQRPRCSARNPHRGDEARSSLHYHRPFEELHAESPSR